VSDSSESLGTASPNGRESIGEATMIMGRVGETTMLLEPVGDAAANRTKGSSSLLTVVGVVIALVAAGVYLFTSFARQDAVVYPKVGDCVPESVLSTQPAAGGLTVVDCASAQAHLRVLGIVDNKTKAQYDADSEGRMCEPFAGMEYLLWFGTDGAGKVACLGSVSSS
jgi:hypothetical protein